MTRRYYAVIDTNVILASLLTRNEDAATYKVMTEVRNRRIIPLYQREILREYEEVLRRPKFHIDEADIRKMIDSVRDNGIEVFPRPTGEVFVDMDDLVFYEVVMEKRDDGAYLITGNLRHFPDRDFIVTPAEMMEIVRRGIR